MVLVSGNLLATETNPEDPTKKLSTQIHELLENNSFEIEDEEMFAQVRFTLNREGEIVVLSVETEDVALEGFVKGRLNYKKVDFDYITEGKMYTVSVRITA